MKTLIEAVFFGLKNTAFNKFRRRIGLLLNFYHRFSKQYQIFELRSLFTTSVSLKSVQVSMHGVV